MSLLNEFEKQQRNEWLSEEGLGNRGKVATTPLNE